MDVKLEGRYVVVPGIGQVVMGRGGGIAIWPCQHIELSWVAQLRRVRYRWTDRQMDGQIDRTVQGQEDPK